MDPLTHTLVGANLASTRLGEKTSLAAAALVIGANAPDIDALAYFIGSDFALGVRRGWTHGVLALLILPLLLAGALMLWDRLVRRDPARRARPWTLLFLSFMAVLTHPCLDWLNNYGIRWLMPFDGTWFYGDSVYIMDPWLWLILGGVWLLGRERSIGLLATWAVFSGLVLWVVGQRSPDHVAAVILVAVGLLAALLWRPPDAERFRRRLGMTALVLAGAFIGFMLTLHALTVARVEQRLAANRIAPVHRLMVGPVPIDPFTWSVVIELPTVYITGSYDWLDGGLQLSPEGLPVPAPSPLWTQAAADPGVAGFMTWVRFPWYVAEETGRGTLVHIMDARYVQSGTEGFGSTRVLLKDLSHHAGLTGGQGALRLEHDLQSHLSGRVGAGAAGGAREQRRPDRVRHRARQGQLDLRGEPAEQQRHW